MRALRELHSLSGKRGTPAQGRDAPKACPRALGRLRGSGQGGGPSHHRDAYGADHFLGFGWEVGRCHRISRGLRGRGLERPQSLRSARSRRQHGARVPRRRDHRYRSGRRLGFRGLRVGAKRKGRGAIQADQALRRHLDPPPPEPQVPRDPAHRGARNNWEGDSEDKEVLSLW